MFKFLRVQAAEVKHGTSKAGRPYSLLALQGTLHYDDGRTEVFVFDFFPRKDQAMPDVKAGGAYIPLIEPQPANDTRKLEARIVGFRAVAEPAKAG